MTSDTSQPPKQIQKIVDELISDVHFSNYSRDKGIVPDYTEARAKGLAAIHALYEQKLGDLASPGDALKAQGHQVMPVVEPAFKVGDTVVNTSGWGVGSTNQIPLTIKSIQLEVEWEGSKSTRILSSKNVEHVATHRNFKAIGE